MAITHPRPVEPQRPGGRRKRIPGEEWITTREGSPFWHFDFTIEGHRLRGSCGTAAFEPACRFIEKQHDLEWRRIKLGEKPAVHLTLDEAFSGWWQDKGKGTAYGEAGQRHQLARIIRILGGETRLADLDDSTVARLMRGLRAGEGVTEGHEKRSNASPATVNRYLATLSVVCRWAREVENAEVGIWSKKPHTMKEPEGVERFLTHEQASAILGGIVAHARAPIALGLLTGARKDNWLHLEWENVSLDLGRALVMGKGGRSLMIVLPPLAVQLLERLQPDPEKRTGPVFTYGLASVACGCAHCVSALYRGDAILDIKRSFRTAAREAGLPGTRMHDLRHTFASWLLEQTGNLLLVSSALHHKQMTTTQRYARLMPGTKEAGIAAATAALGNMPALAGPTEKKEVA